jgi:hypothetical protein
MKMSEVNLIDLIDCDIFINVQKFLTLKDLFSLRCVNVKFKNYINCELGKLKRIDLPRAHPSAFFSFQVLSERCNYLEKINLNKNEWLSDDLLLSLLQRNTETLTSLSLNDCNNLTAASIQPVIIRCKKLEKLSLQRNIWLTVGSIDAITFHQDNLRELDLSYCDTISERSLVIFCNKFLKLQVLNLSSIRSVSDNLLLNISINLHDLKFLNLFKCIAITNRGLKSLAVNCNKLESLLVCGCPNITEESLSLLRKRNVHIDRPQNLENSMIHFNQRMNLFLQV